MRTAIQLFFVCLILWGCSGVTPPAPEPSATPPPQPTATFTPAPTPAPVWLGNYPLLSPQAMQNDLATLFDRLQTMHPNLYGRRSRDEVDAERRRLAQELGQPLTAIAYYRKVAPLVASLGDYHTTVSLPGEVLAIAAGSERFLPAVIRLEDERGYILYNFSGDDRLKTGSQVLAVNGLSLDAIAVRARLYEPYERNLDPALLWIALGSAVEYRLELVEPGAAAAHTLRLPGLPVAGIASHAPQNPLPALEYKPLPGAVGLLTVRNFDDLGRDLAQVFTQIQAGGVENLVLDIRDNSGGKYDQVFSLMDYLTGQPYRQCSSSIGAPPGLGGSGDPLKKPCELIQPFDAPQRFGGRLYLLVGPDTISAGVTLASILQDYGLATLVGEETLTPASYCGDVVTQMQTLPETGLLYQVSRTCYTRPGGAMDGLGVVPDVVVKTSVADMLAGSDPVLDETLRLIREGQGSP